MAANQPTENTSTDRARHHAKRIALLRRLERESDTELAAAGADSSHFDAARVEAVVAQLTEIGGPNGLRDGFAVLVVGGAGSPLLETLSMRFPQADCYGVDWAEPASADPRYFGVDVDELFRTSLGAKRDGFDLVVLADGFALPAGRRSNVAPEWADGWLGKHSAYTIGVADRARLRQLRERGGTKALERARDDGGLVCWSERYPEIGAGGAWARRRRRFTSFPAWSWQNARRYGTRDALYFARKTVSAIADGRLPLEALHEDDLRARFCATLRPGRRTRGNTTYVFVFLGEFGYEL
jgi:hypothetical protein